MNEWELRHRIASKIVELRFKIARMEGDFESMQSLQSQVEVLKEVLGDESDGIENHWFDLYELELERRIQKRGS